MDRVEDTGGVVRERMGGGGGGVCLETDGFLDRNFLMSFRRWRKRGGGGE